MFSRTIRYQLERSRPNLLSHRNVFSMSESNDHCMNFVKQYDHENYLAGLLIPNKYRNAYYAIRSFNIEIAMIKDQVPRNTFHAGRIRIQFWRDVLDKIYNGSSDTGVYSAAQANHPLLKALEHAIKEYGLTQRWFERSLEGRYKDIANTDLLEKMDDLEDFSETNHSSILYLLLEILNVKGHQNAEYAVSHAGVCSGIIATLRSCPTNSAKGLCYFPMETLSKHQLTSSTILKGPKKAEDFTSLKDSTHDIAMQAAAHLKRARELSQEGLPSNSVHALMPAVIAEHYLDLLNKHNYDPFMAALNDRQSTFSLQLKMMKAKLTNKL